MLQVHSSKFTVVEACFYISRRPGLYTV